MFHALTVEELRKICERLCAQRAGNRIILIPDFHNPNKDMGIYRTINSVRSTNEPELCVYIQINDDDKETKFWKGGIKL